MRPSLLLLYRLVPSSGWKVLTGKYCGKFYKGKGSMKTGVHTTKGQYVLMKSMRPQYVVPDLTDFKLKPYVAHSNEEQPDTIKNNEERHAK